MLPLLSHNFLISIKRILYPYTEMLSVICIYYLKFETHIAVRISRVVEDVEAPSGESGKV